jgi:polysaccharide export outer membrane protein
MKFSIRDFFYLLLLVVAISSCTSYKKVPYLQPEEGREREYQLISYYKDRVIRYQPNDILGITVNVPGEPALATDYNLPFQPVATTDNSGDGYINTGVGRQTFYIDKDGYIDYPVIGRIKAEGFTQQELEIYIKERIAGAYLKSEPIVTIRLLNFRIMVQGEVNRPGVYSTARDHINIIEALTMAGDMTIYGKRDAVRIRREMPDGSIKFLVVDISKDSVVSSPDFYLQQNDIVIVTPNKSRADYSDVGPQLSIMLTLGSFAMTLISFVIYISSR